MEITLNILNKQPMTETKKARLAELLTDYEFSSLRKNFNVLAKQVKDLTVQELNDISLYIIRTEHGEKPQSLNAVSEVLRILTERAIKEDLPIF